MSGPSKVLVLDPDPRAARQLQLGLARDGVTATIVAPADALSAEKADLVLVGGVDGAAVELVRRARAELAEVPIVFAGRGAARGELHAAGADEIVMQPAYLRDVVTIARLLAGTPADQRDHLVGSLVETTTVYALVRALSALGRSAVLTLIRGLRRGEVRFWDGEVTSAQVGLIHGQAALHQLLLWTDARFDFAHEDVVRRQQIPLPPDELFADAERFLAGVRDCAGGLSPAMVLEQDVQRVHDLGKQIPTEVHGVLRMFDGHRVLADVLEDSPYRVFETLRVAQKAVEAGLLRAAAAPRAKSTFRAVLAIEEWLVGKDTREAVVERTAKLDSGPAGLPRKTGGSRKKRKKKRSQTPPAGMKPIAPPPVKAEIDWGALVPRVIGAEVGPLSGVVPAMDTHGEIDVASRGAPREGLEALMDTDKRQRIFPTDIGLEPSVVVRAEPEPAAAPAAAAAVDEDIKTEPVATATPEPAPTSISEATPTVPVVKAEPVAPPQAEAEVDREREQSEARVRESVQRMRLEREEREAREAAEAKAKADAERSAAAEDARAYAARVKAAAEAKQREAEPAPEPTPAPADTEVVTKQTDPLTIVETPEAVVKVVDTVTVTTAADTAYVAATPTVTVTSVPPHDPAAPTPSLADVSPSDGIVRAMIATADTAKVAARERARRASEHPPPDTGPPVKETSGEIGGRAKASAPDLRASEPSILLGDLAAAHDVAIHAVAHAAPDKPPAKAETPAADAAVSQLRKDALAVSEAEEAFFKHADRSSQIKLPTAETFEDLDEGYEPPGFWDRVFGRKKPKK